MQELKQSYRDAFSAWQTQLQSRHHVLLDGERQEPPALLGRAEKE